MDAQVTAILRTYRHDPDELSRRLMPVVYETLRSMARRQMVRERRRLTLQPTALVHEAYLRLLGQEATWENRRHFYGASAEAMSRILIEHARRRGRLKRGAPMVHVALDELPAGERSLGETVVLSRALAKLERLHRRKSRVVELRFLVGLTLQEIAGVLDVSVATVKLDWSFAKVWLYRELYGERAPHDGTKAG